MSSHRSFLVLGGDAADIVSLVKGGIEILSCSFSFSQNIDKKGKVASRVTGGTMQLVLSQLPPQPIIEWAVNSRRYQDGIIIMLDNENVPVEKIIFENAACIDFSIDYTQKGTSYTMTNLVIQPERVIVGNGIDFDNEWSTR
ncbi:MAG: hypothetical protein RL662_45 [Bacteroidota bacterium]|jgi:hypothetical protein